MLASTLQKVLSITALLTCIGTAGCAHAEAPRSEPCQLEDSLKEQTENNFPGYTLVTGAQLGRNDAKFFRADHDNRCPGLVAGDFLGRGAHTYGLLLIKQKADQLQVELVVAIRKDSASWHLKRVDGFENKSAPVIWVEPAGRYPDAAGDRTIQAKYPVLVLAEYESWAIMYWWNGSKMDKMWISD